MSLTARRWANAEVSDVSPENKTPVILHEFLNNLNILHGHFLTLFSCPNLLIWVCFYLSWRL